MKRTLTVPAALMLVAILNASASLAILNAGFEDPIIGTYTSGTTINDWDTIVGDGGGVWNINAFPAGFWTSSAPEGNQVGWLSGAPNGGPTYVRQTLTETVVLGDTYTLSGYVGHPIGFGASLDPDTEYTVSILAGGILVASVSGTGPEGSFVPFSISWTGNLLHAGELLGVELKTSQAQTAFDNLSMVPEPTTMIAGALLLLPFVASTIRYLRKHRMA